MTELLIACSSLYGCMFLSKPTYSLVQLSPCLSLYIGDHDSQLYEIKGGNEAGAHPKRRRRGGGGLRAEAPLPKIEIKRKNTDFVYTIISNVLHDLPSSRSQPVKPADA
jgi:hypothetical protein